MRILNGKSITIKEEPSAKIAGDKKRLVKGRREGHPISNRDSALVKESSVKLYE